jgi:hypothetical protein
VARARDSFMGRCSWSDSFEPLIDASKFFVDRRTNKARAIHSAPVFLHYQFVDLFNLVVKKPDSRVAVYLWSSGSNLRFDHWLTINTLTINPCKAILTQ